MPRRTLLSCSISLCVVIFAGYAVKVSRQRQREYALIFESSDTTNCRDILLDIQHRITVIARIQWNIINGLRTVAHHFRDPPF